jgi:hypothetical protein
MAVTGSETPLFLPEQVGSAWALLAHTAIGFNGDAEVASPVEQARWAAVDASFHHPALDLAQAWVEAELRVIEAAEAVKAWADFQGLTALRRLHEATGMVVRENVEEIGRYTPNAVSCAAVIAETITSTVDEVALATGLPEGAVAARLDLARNEEGRSGLLLASLADGEVTLERAFRIHEATSGLDPEVARAVAARVLLRNPDGSVVRSHRSFTRELRRQVVVHTPDPAEARRGAAEAMCLWMAGTGWHRSTHGRGRRGESDRRLGSPGSAGAEPSGRRGCADLGATTVRRGPGSDPPRLGGTSKGLRFGAADISRTTTARASDSRHGADHVAWSRPAAR